MICVGPCLINNDQEAKDAIKLAKDLKRTITHFRAKIIGGGTQVDKFKEGIGWAKGMDMLRTIEKIIPTGTEVQTPDQLNSCLDLSYVWVGARNSQNYSLLKHISYHKGDVLLKRGVGMTLEETIGIFDIMRLLFKKEPYIIERGINGIDRIPSQRWHIDLNSILRLKNYRKDIFNKLIVDCSHSAGSKELVGDIYEAMKSIGVKHFMFECTQDGKSQTDQGHMLSVKELKRIIK